MHDPPQVMVSSLRFCVFCYSVARSSNPLRAQLIGLCLSHIHYQRVHPLQIRRGRGSAFLPMAKSVWLTLALKLVLS